MRRVGILLRLLFFIAVGGCGGCAVWFDFIALTFRIEFDLFSEPFITTDRSVRNTLQYEPKIIVTVHLDMIAEGICGGVA